MNIYLSGWVIPLIITVLSLIWSYFKADKEFNIAFYVYGFFGLIISLISWIGYVIWILL
jgi:hypothetical protein